MNVGENIKISHQKTAQYDSKKLITLQVMDIFFTITLIGLSEDIFISQFWLHSRLTYLYSAKLEISVFKSYTFQTFLAMHFPKFDELYSQVLTNSSLKYSQKLNFKNFARKPFMFNTAELWNRV